MTGLLCTAFPKNILWYSPSNGRNRHKLTKNETARIERKSKKGVAAEDDVGRRSSPIGTKRSARMTRQVVDLRTIL